MNLRGGIDKSSVIVWQRDTFLCVIAALLWHHSRHATYELSPLPGNLQKLL
jgi:hypothetical protein